MILVTRFLLVLSLHVAVWAQASVPDPNAQIDLKAYKCSEYLNLGDEEDPRADVRTVWAHGYYSALRRLDEASKLITSQTLIDFAGRLQKSCREDPARLFIRALKALK